MNPLGYVRCIAGGAKRWARACKSPAHEFQVHKIDIYCPAFVLQYMCGPAGYKANDRGRKMALSKGMVKIVDIEGENGGREQGANLGT